MLLLAERASEAPQLLSIACSACHRARFWTRLLCRPAQRCPALRAAPLTSEPGPGGSGPRPAHSSGCRGGFPRPPRGPQHPSSLRVPPRDPLPRVGALRARPPRGALRTRARPRTRPRAKLFPGARRRLAPVPSPAGAQF